MNEIYISFHATITTIGIMDNEKARAVYTKISSALKEYRLFKNDVETIEVESDAGPVTLRLERMDNVIFNDGLSIENDIRHKLSAEKLARSIREELGLPEMPTRPFGT